MSQGWFRHGILNTLEHGVTRVADAATTLVLLWVLAPEVFSKLALAQALVAPMLVLFLSPDIVIYRDYHRWKAAGAQEIATRLHAFRIFSWGKGLFAVLLSLLVAIPADFFETRFYSVLWAFALALGPQLSGPDREFLRLDLKLEELNLISLYQKISLLAGTVFVAAAMDARIDALAMAAIFSIVTTALLAGWRVRSALERAKPRPGEIVSTLRESIATFSLWQHFSGVVLGWVQTMDLFFLGAFGLPAREVGLYAASLKFANFSLALPTALGNLFGIWVGRQGREHGNVRELKVLRKYSGLLFLGGSLQGLVLALLAPFLFSLLSRGRWNESEVATMVFWFRWIVSGGVLFGSSLFAHAWVTARTPVSGIFGRIYLPWLLFSGMIYSAAVAIGGANAAAIANLPVALAYLALLFHYLRKTG